MARRNAEAVERYKEQLKEQSKDKADCFDEMVGGCRKAGGRASSRRAGGSAGCVFARACWDAAAFCVGMGRSVLN